MSRPKPGWGKDGYSFGGAWGDAAAEREKENAEKAKLLSGYLPLADYSQVMPQTKQDD